jgi:hypothetical protein
MPIRVGQNCETSHRPTRSGLQRHCRLAARLDHWMKDTVQPVAEEMLGGRDKGAARTVNSLS